MGEHQALPEEMFTKKQGFFSSCCAKSQDTPIAIPFYVREAWERYPSKMDHHRKYTPGEAARECSKGQQTKMLLSVNVPDQEITTRIYDPMLTPVSVKTPLHPLESSLKNRLCAVLAMLVS